MGDSNRKNTVGVGTSDNQISREAAKEATRKAIEGGELAQPDLVLFYTSEQHDPRQLQAGIREIAGPDARIMGGYSMGVITNDYLGYDGFQVGAAVFQFNDVDIDLFIEKELANREQEVGRALGQQINARAYKTTPNIFFMYDSVIRSAAEGLSLNMATPLLEGMGETFESWPPIAGVGMSGGMQWNPTYQWLDDEIYQNTALALALSGDVEMHTTILHGCKPAGSYKTITKAKSNVIYEIDNSPALDVIDEMMGLDADWDEYPLFLTLGLNKGDKFGEFKQDEYANRLCMAISRDDKSLVMFEPDLKEGSEVRLMRRSIDFEYIRPSVEDFLLGLDGKRPFFALYIDCLARASAYCGSESEEAEQVQKALGNIPLLGMYSGVEIAKVGQDIQPLDWTGVLCVFTDNNQLAV
jgi:hypothetical protein